MFFENIKSVDNIISVHNIILEVQWMLGLLTELTKT